MDKDFKKILVGVDDSEDALAAFRYAIHRAKADDAELIIASVLESDEMNVYQALTKDYVHGERAELAEHLNKYVELAEKAGIKNVRAVIGEGDAGETIIKQIIPKVDPDLLIIGAMAKKGIARHFGSQAAYMAKYAEISVLVVRD
ncbi:universal stress protein [Lacticaseibacillus pantheris]|uniref:universal stress protein n=1 Tax=Lacticaseibacillus pantheris TaxID=171523 RepID=UPI0025949C96|nr:universal stress protein [Lacticaseibacillus pantheris]WKF84630.1 universal stress protein [Lacticaseibacillus pantheris]